jgi:2-aminoadipate transaminase
MTVINRAGVRFSSCGQRLKQPVITRLMATALATPGLLSLAAGFTDTEGLPSDTIWEVVDKILRQPGLPESLQYGTNAGRPLLRELLGRRISQQDRNLSDAYPLDNLFITNGSQQALALATQVLCDPGDIVLVEKPTYFVYLDVLRGLGVQVQNLPVDDHQRLDIESLDEWLDDLERKGDLGRLKAVYLQGYYANPTSRTLSEAEKNGIAQTLRRRGLFLPVIEDAAYRELYYTTLPVERSILALDAFIDFPRLYLGTLTKSFATGLKVGFGYCTDQEWLNRILFLKGQQDFGTANFNQAILEEVLRGDYLDRYLPTVRRHYERKMQVLHETLEAEGLRDEGWKWDRPSGGLYLWLTGPAGIDTAIDSPFGQRCLAHGVLYVPGDLCCGEGGGNPFVRLSFGVLSLSDLRLAGQRLAQAIRSGANAVS